MTIDKIDRVGMSYWHTQDCAAFISLSSTALPRYVILEINKLNAIINMQIGLGIEQ